MENKCKNRRGITNTKSYEHHIWGPKEFITRFFVWFCGTERKFGFI